MQKAKHVKMTLYLDPDVVQWLRLRRVMTAEPVSTIANRIIRADFARLGDRRRPSPGPAKVS